MYLNIIRPNVNECLGLFFLDCHVCYSILFLETIKGLYVFIYYAVLNYRRSVIRISIELQLLSNPVHRKVRNYHLYIITYECKAFGLMSFCLFYQQDLIVRLTDDTDLYFLYNLVISEEDFQRYSDLIFL